MRVGSLPATSGSVRPTERIDVAGHERREEPLALLRARVEVEHDGVLHAHGSDRELTVLRASDDLVQIDEVHERQTAAADLLRMAERARGRGASPPP